MTTVAATKAYNITVTSIPPVNVDATTEEMTAESSFESLPLEIRNEIYSLVVVQEDIIKLRSFAGKPEPGGTTTSRPVVLQNFRNQGKHRGQVYVPFCPRGWVDAPPTFMALLSVNKAIRAEASAIVYGRNTFSFSTAKAATSFLQLIADAKVHVREIIVEERAAIRRDLVPLLSELVDAKCLRTLVLPTWENGSHHWCRLGCGLRRQGNDATLQELAVMLKPILTVLHESYRKQGLTASVLDIVQPYSDRLQELLRYHLRFVLGEELDGYDAPRADVLQTPTVSTPKRVRRKKARILESYDSDF